MWWAFEGKCQNQWWKQILYILQVCIQPNTYPMCVYAAKQHECSAMRTRKTTNPFSILFDNTLRCLSMQSHDFDITDYIQSNGTLRIQYSIWKTSTFCCECMRFLHSFSLISLCGTPFSYVLSLRLSLYLRNKSKIRFKVMNLPKHRESHVSPACLAFSVPSNSILFVRNELFSLSLFSLNNETRLLSNPISALIVFSFSP